MPKPSGQHETILVAPVEGGVLDSGLSGPSKDVVQGGPGVPPGLHLLGKALQSWSTS